MEILLHYIALTKGEDRPSRSLDHSDIDVVDKFGGQV